MKRVPLPHSKSDSCPNTPRLASSSHDAEMKRCGTPLHESIYAQPDPQPAMNDPKNFDVAFTMTFLRQSGSSHPPRKMLNL